VSLLAVTAVGARQNNGPLALGSSAFESYIELLRQQAGIPAISGILLQDGKVVWEQGLGFADAEARIRATPDTPYLVGDVTQAFSSVLLLQCVEERRLDLEQPVSAYGVSLPDSSATLRQVLSHSYSAAAGGSFRYEPARFAELAAVMEHCIDQPFRKSIAERLLERLAMVDSVPGMDLRNDNTAPDGSFDSADLARYTRVLGNLAVPYRVDRRGRASRNDPPADGINAATGLISTVRDLARFDDALDDGDVLDDDTLEEAWSATRLPGGAAAPMGLGWFVQTYRGARIVWHAGYIPNAYSTLYVKVPSRRATMILLANNDGLVVPSVFETGDVTRSLYASVFLRMLL
jgi:CubicO group peptidase (beta-lactamase class C family)